MCTHVYICKRHVYQISYRYMACKCSDKKHRAFKKKFAAEIYIPVSINVNICTGKLHKIELNYTVVPPF